MAALPGMESTIEASGARALVDEGALRAVSFSGREIVRLIDYPIRDADWGTLPTVTEDGEVEGDRVRRRFRTADGGIVGRFEAWLAPEGAGARLRAELVLEARRDVVVNRAGFILLHPLAGVAGEPVDVRHPDGTHGPARFPSIISPSQPVRDIAGLTHRVDGIEVMIAFDGDVFEMEDQRNWTDASFKTYCRPLAWPRPYTLRTGDTVRQTITVTMREAGGGARRGAPVATATARMPEVFLAHEEPITGAPSPALGQVGAQGILLRARAGALAVPELEGIAGSVTAELVTGTDARPELLAACEAFGRAGVRPDRVVALPQGYLSSHQPEGPWPAGPAPSNLVALVRAAFPDAEAGGGMLTNFTEFNRCPPDPARIDFATFGTTAIVHAADDRSVVETLEAIPDVIASARALAGDRPLRLGLMAIGMRSNPYGAGVMPNPSRARVPMAMDDPRQRTAFAAAFAVGLAAACARGGVASFAPAMTGGPLGMGDADGVWPIWHAVAALAALAGAEVRVEGGPASGLVSIRGRGRRGIAGVAANLGPGPATVAAGAVVVPDRAPPDWIDRAEPEGSVTLAPMTVAVLRDV